MFDWFKGNDNVYKSPLETEMISPVPTTYKANPTTYYSIGPTNDNRIAFVVAATTLTMSKVACQQLVNLLNAAIEQLNDNTED